MITAYRISPDRCNGCFANGRVVEFKLQPADGCYKTMQLCHACCAELQTELRRIEQVEAAWPNTETAQADTSKRLPVTRKKPTTTRKRPVTKSKKGAKARKRA